jgi:hypothetical protein
LKRRVLKIIATVVLAIIGALFTAMMRQFGIAFSGGGVGTRFFHFLVAGPEGVCLLIWPILFPLLPWRSIPRIAITILILAAIPIAWAAVVLTGEGVQDDAIRQIWNTSRPVVYIFSILFLLPSVLGFGIAMIPGIRALTNLRRSDNPE